MDKGSVRTLPDGHEFLAFAMRMQTADRLEHQAKRLREAATWQEAMDACDRACDAAMAGFRGIAVMAPARNGGAA